MRKLLVILFLSLISSNSLSEIICKENFTQVANPEGRGISLKAFGAYIFLPSNYHVLYSQAVAGNPLIFDGVQYDDQGYIDDSKDIGTAQIGKIEDMPDFIAQDAVDAHYKVECKGLSISIGRRQNHEYLLVIDKDLYFSIIDYRDQFWLEVLENFIHK